MSDFMCVVKLRRPSDSLVRDVLSFQISEGGYICWCAQTRIMCTQAYRVASHTNREFGDAAIDGCL